MRITDEQRRARLARRHHLAVRAGDVVTVARDLAGLHATDPASVYLAAAARLKQPTVEAMDRALYEDRSLLRMLGMRRTLFVEPLELVPVVQASSTAAVAARTRAAIVRDIERYDIAPDGGAWLRAAEAETLAALRARGSALAVELSADVPHLRARIRYGEGKAWEGLQGMTTRVLTQLSADGHIVRGRPKGNWTSSRYQWTSTDAWLGVPWSSVAKADAQAELVRRWLASFGPASVADVRWWTGWSAGDVKAALATVGVEEVELDHGPGVVLAGDTAPVRSPKPWAALLPSLDPTSMGWTDRDWYLGPEGRVLFDRSGNIGPTVWWCGRIVGGWAQRPDASVVYRLITDLGRDATAAIDAEAERLDAWLAGVKVTPRFPTPLQRELATA